MICIIAFVVFGILGIFSTKYRQYFWESLNCLTQRVTLRKCNASFDLRMKIKITSKLSKINNVLGRFVYKNFNMLSWIVTIIMIVLFIWSAYVSISGIYNWFVFGNCYGPESIQSCILNELSGHTQTPLEQIQKLFK